MPHGPQAHPAYGRPRHTQRRPAGGPTPTGPGHRCRAVNAPPHQHPGQEPTSGLLKPGPCKQSHSPVAPNPQVDGEQGTHHIGCMGSRAGRSVVCSCLGRPEMEVAGRPEVRLREWPVVGEPLEGQTDLVGEVEVRSRNLWTDRRQTQTRCSRSSAARTTCIHPSSPAWQSEVGLRSKPRVPGEWEVWASMKKDLLFPIRNESDLGLDREWQPDLVVGWLAWHGKATKLQCPGSLVTDGPRSTGLERFGRGRTPPAG